MKALRELKADELTVRIYSDRTELGRASAEEAAEALKRLLDEKSEVNVVFAAAPSQNEFLDALVRAPGIDWSRVNAFHMDEYVGLDEKAPQRFGNFLKERLFGKVPFKTVHYIDGNADDPERECIRYARLLERHPADIACMGIGENGHIAFNDPHVARFDDGAAVKTVELDARSRGQQVNDGCFARTEDVPTHALTLTIPALLSAARIFCVVPGKAKAEAVAKTLYGEISEDCPASILRTHGGAVLYLDVNSAGKTAETEGGA